MEMKQYQVWSIIGGKLFQCIALFDKYEDAWEFILTQDVPSGFVVRYFDK